MFSKIVWLFLLLVPLRGQLNERQTSVNYERIDELGDVPNSEEEERVRREIRKYFADVSNWDELCNKSLQSFGVNICEMEGGHGKDNKNGRLLMKEKKYEHENAPHILVPREERREWQGHTIESFRGTNLKKGRNLMTCPIYKHHYHGNHNHTQFDKSILFLVADPNFDIEDLQTVKGALDRFNYCTEDMIDFEMETHLISTDIAGMNWMEATYKVLNEAVEMGIDLNMTESNDRDNTKFKFDTGEHMTLIILPDDVDFKGAYGFAALHYGLSVLSSNVKQKGKYVLHEIGHNLGLKHSSSPDGGEYGDDRCFMGDQKHRGVCFNGAKSYYLGLYMDYTAVFRSSETACNAVVNIADAKDHLRNRSEMSSMYGQYYVLAYVRIRIGTKIKRAYMMYYKDDDIIAVTTGGLGTIRTNDGDRLQYADVSRRIFDLEENYSRVYNGVLIKRCPSSGVARVLISFDPNALNECY